MLLRNGGFLVTEDITESCRHFDHFYKSLFGKPILITLKTTTRKKPTPEIFCSLVHLWVTVSTFKAARRNTVPKIVTKTAYCNKAAEIFPARRS